MRLDGSPQPQLHYYPFFFFLFYYTLRFVLFVFLLIHKGCLDSNNPYDFWFSRNGGVLLIYCLLGSTVDVLCILAVRYSSINIYF
jgi:hypothetical protein